MSSNDRDLIEDKDPRQYGLGFWSPELHEQVKELEQEIRALMTEFCKAGKEEQAKEFFLKLVDAGKEYLTKLRELEK